MPTSPVDPTVSASRASAAPINASSAIDGSTIVNTVNMDPTTFIELTYDQIAQLSASDAQKYAIEVKSLQLYGLQISTTISTELNQNIIQIPYVNDLQLYTDQVNAMLTSQQPIFIQSTMDELEQMNLIELQLYANSLSSFIYFQQSSIAMNQSIERQYDYLILTSQSTIVGVNYALIENSNNIIAGDINTAQLISTNAELDYTIGQYNSSIYGNVAIVSGNNSVLSSLVLDLNNIDSTLLFYDTQFISAAVEYSTLYWQFAAADIVYSQNISSIYQYSSFLLSTIAVEQILYWNLRTSTDTYSTAVLQLSTYNGTSNELKSTNTQYIINEITESSFLYSTNMGIKSLSSLYEASIITQSYNRSLSTQGTVLENYMVSYSTFVTISSMKRDSVLNIAFNMERQRLDSIILDREKISTNIAGLRLQTANAYIDSYETDLNVAQANIQFEINNINRYDTYIYSSLNSISNWSSLYESAIYDVASSIAAISVYSTFYDSSIVGSNALIFSAQQDDTLVAAIQLSTNAISYNISSLNEAYNRSMTDYSYYINQSSIYTSTLISSMVALSMYSSFYDSTTLALDSFITSLTSINRSTMINKALIRANSSILEYEYINMLTYDTNIKANFNIEDSSVFQYRETYVRQKRMDIDKQYSAAVLHAVQTVSTQNASLAKSTSGATFTPIVVDITTGEPGVKISKLISITNFLNSFGTIYAAYDKQTENIQNVSTSIGNQQPTLSTLQSYSDQGQLNPFDTLNIANINNTQTAYISLQQQTVALQQTVLTNQAEIDALKTTYFTTYNSLFTPTELITNENMISSFLQQGYQNAIVPAVIDTNRVLATTSAPSGASRPSGS